jgi:hypothetical protein
MEEHCIRVICESFVHTVDVIVQLVNECSLVQPAEIKIWSRSRRTQRLRYTVYHRTASSIQAVQCDAAALEWDTEMGHTKSNARPSPSLWSMHGSKPASCKKTTWLFCHFSTAFRVVTVACIGGSLVRPTDRRGA